MASLVDDVFKLGGRVLDKKKPRQMLELLADWTKILLCFNYKAPVTSL
jgi:hypothetical protein